MRSNSRIDLFVYLKEKILQFYHPLFLKIYSQINQEIKNGDIKTTLWTKAEALTDGGNEQQVKSKYVKLRFEQIKEDGF